MLKIKVKNEINYPLVKAETMEIGDIMEVHDIDVEDKFILRTFDGLVSLTNPHHTWCEDAAIHGRVLPKGTILTLKIK